MNRNFVEMLSALSDAGAEYLIVGAHAMAAHQRPRATGDLDIWVRPTRENAERVRRALVEFGAPVEGISVDELSQPGLIFQFGFPPFRIDIITVITGVTFEEAWPNRITVDVGGREHAVIGIQDLIRNKRATARPQDLVDAENLENP